MKKNLLMVLAFGILIILMSCESRSNEVQNNSQQVADSIDVEENTEEAPLITFLEFGSINCIACKKMKPLLDKVEIKYGNQIKVVFHDVWKEENKKIAQQYSIRLIPTQVFLDKEGKEIYRHEGYIPESEIDRFLQENGLNIKKNI